ncbi:MAG: TldD/PmbA family protein [Actinomycetota bacterium]
MMTRDEVAKILSQTLAYSEADQTEVALVIKDSSLTRFSNSYIHQNVVERNVRLTVRAIMGKKIGCADTNSLGDSSIKETVDLALQIARHTPPNPDFVSLPEKVRVPRGTSFVEDTARVDPEQRAQTISVIISKASKNNLIAAGAFSTGTIAIGVANSLGVEAIDHLSEASLSVVVMSENSSGYADFLSKDVKEINPEVMADIAIEKALRGKNPISIERGTYSVILEQSAVANLLGYLSFCGLGALSVQEGRSFMCQKFGQRITGESITLWDDALDERTLGLPFDLEGVPKQKVMLIEDGIAKNVVYDSYTAHKEGKKSTGHALPLPNIHGPLPSNLFLKAGHSSLQEMISSTERGILITRFHYLNVEDPVKTILTGMTRDGTFLIEKGEIKRGIKNLRFTQSILEALSNVEMISKDFKLKGDSFILCCVPTLKLSEFNFTGITES